MREMIKMVVVLTVLSAFSGGLLAAIRNNTQDKIEMQQLTFVKGPAIKGIFEGAKNDPIQDRFTVKDGDTEHKVFVGLFDGKPNAVAMEGFGKGYGGDVGVMFGINLEDDTFVGAGVTTHAETPGMGARAKEDPTFVAQFKGKSAAGPIKVTKDGGEINALSGATITSRAVSAAATQVGETYMRLKPEIQEQVKAFTK